MYMRISDTDPSIGEQMMEVKQAMEQRIAGHPPSSGYFQLLVNLDARIAKLEAIVYAPTRWQKFVKWVRDLLSW